MNVLALNAGSSTLKFQLWRMEGNESAEGAFRSLARGVVDRIGTRATIEFAAEKGEPYSTQAAVADHAEAARIVLDWVRSLDLLGGEVLGAVGHRVVHGGDRFVEATPIDEEVVRAIEEVSSLAPLHNGPALAAIREARAFLGDRVPMVAVFDTAFHSSLPDRARRYAIPDDLALKHGVRRYGFHGIAHRYMLERYCAATSRPPRAVKLVTLQLGNGCSAAAVAEGRSVDTSMGFTPLEGLVMGTRCGDIDPSVVGFLARRAGVRVEEVEGWLNSRSGLLGVSGRSKDMRELLDAEREGDERAALAVDMFCYRVKKYVGAYFAALGGAEAVVFGGGIGENAPAVRARVCSDMEWCGVALDRSRNESAAGVEAVISADHSRTKVYVMLVDEEAVIARDTARCVGTAPR